MGCDQSRPAHDPTLVTITPTGGCTGGPGEECSGCSEMRFEEDKPMDPRLSQFINQEQYKAGLRRVNEENFKTFRGKWCTNYRWLVGFFLVLGLERSTKGGSS